MTTIVKEERVIHQKEIFEDGSQDSRYKNFGYRDFFSSGSSGSSGSSKSSNSYSAIDIKEKALAEAKKTLGFEENEEITQRSLRKHYYDEIKKCYPTTQGNIEENTPENAEKTRKIIEANEILKMIYGIK